MKIYLSILILVSGVCVVSGAELPTAQVRVDFSKPGDPLEMDRMALGQGGLSEEPMWADRIPEIRALRPRFIRLFIQEYFDLLPEPGRYHFDTLDRSVETILRTGAAPLMCICCKPKVLFPQVNQDIVEPVDYAEWEKLIFEVVRHYKKKSPRIRYWEVGNEPDIGEDGGCPYRFKPDSYARYYRHTAAAVRRADPEARIGGPALAYVRSPILPALLDLCRSGQVPLHFVSWHIYSSDPKAVRGTIDYVHDLLKSYPDPKPETFPDEWNMDLTNPPLDPRFQPCYVAETIWQMIDAGLDYSCYYHIRDWYVSYETFVRFMSPQGTAFMTRWWNRMPQFDGLFDFQNHVRPTYFTFKLLSRLNGQRIGLTSSHPAIHGLASFDEQLRMFNIMLWNYSHSPVECEVSLEGLSQKMRLRRRVLDAQTASGDENARLRPDPFQTVEKGNCQFPVRFEAYAIHSWTLE
ncbi:MAG: hypothetical protein JW828_11685 [Sedimentisphaerales bacterium]|nr:hypothetical protein [Sedimentisphaerales bacterium]